MAEWSPAEYRLLASALAAQAADARSTQRIEAEEGGELNPILGKHPSNAEINRYMLATALAGTGIAHMLPDSMRASALGGWTGMEAMLAKQNLERKPHKNLADVMKKPLVVGALAALLAHQLPRDGALGIVPTKDNGVALSLTKKF